MRMTEYVGVNAFSYAILTVTLFVTGEFEFWFSWPTQDQSTWDEDKLFGCVCDSTWNVGLDSGETQATTWFGPDCSLSKLVGAK